MTDQKIDLANIVHGNNQKYELAVTNESPEDAQARRDEAKSSADHKRKINFILFCVAIAMVAIVFFGCIATIAVDTSPDDKKWASTLVASITSGLIGFLVGQSKK